ncbi:hypothetical protein SDC9_142827 [bioreactor metagenome]|uniref:Uncharacterized protein n=1 Tax=bioreactor metagenome TaxID=1076179 RepID=A0A645E517_9ZZZZ
MAAAGKIGKDQILLTAALFYVPGCCLGMDKRALQRIRCGFARKAMVRHAADNHNKLGFGKRGGNDRRKTLPVGRAADQSCFKLHGGQHRIYTAAHFPTAVAGLDDYQPHVLPPVVFCANNLNCQLGCFFYPHCLSTGNRRFNQACTVETAFGFGNQLQLRAGAGVTGRKDGTAVLIG